MLTILNSPQSYPRLFEPGAIGGPTIANRLVRAFDAGRLQPTAFALS